MNLPRLSHQLRRLLSLPVAIVSLALASCYGPVAVDQSFKSNRQMKVAVITMQAPTASVHHVGSQGLLDMAANHAMATGGRRELESYPSQAKLDEAGKQFAKRLSSHGYKATHLPSIHPTYKDINPMTAKPSASKPIPGTGSYLNGYDAAIYLSMPAVGRAKLVYAFIPLSGSSAIAPMQGAMYSTSDQKILWRSAIPVINTGDGVSIDGDGKDALYRAIDTAVKASSDKVQSHFFEGF
ncbi:hypothetical protein OKA04_20130 [Luteolibacter flavescens]|uniref:Lipoprotein n=1 Tax=Luteolibacter flavescens TaxID=1859460 RepID=A0ABT3FU38_9BACT|nr:hypothetical protein [Luteolibacter flavescens]MCW1887057.1 hypothetical protein [Luteolibacter flavescens]